VRVTTVLALRVGAGCAAAACGREAAGEAWWPAAAHPVRMAAVAATTVMAAGRRESFIALFSLG
jgi:hypothetical protein